MNLLGNKIFLRSLEKEDLDFLFRIENDEQFWELSSTQVPFSKETLENYIENSKTNIHLAGQYRFTICSIEDNKTIGFIDLFEFDSIHSRAGVGIIIQPEYHNQGFGTDALSVLINYCRKELNLHQLYANILEHNVPSLRLFENQGFIRVGVKKDWIFYKDSYKNEIILQLILD